MFEFVPLFHTFMMPACMEEVRFRLPITILSPDLLCFLEGGRKYSQEKNCSSFIGGNITWTMDGSYGAASLFAQATLLVLKRTSAAPPTGIDGGIVSVLILSYGPRNISSYTRRVETVLSFH